MDGLSPYVLEQIISGRAVLFLGAGASIPSRGSNATEGLSTSKLRDKLCDKFLGGEGKTRALNYISDRCENIAGMQAFHRYLKELMGDLQPTPGHLLIPKFRWRGIVTTNYDFLIERAYEQCRAKQQNLERIIWDRDDFDSITKNPDCIALLKLHGCLSRINDPSLPLVISSYDYYKFKQNRAQLVSTFREWGENSPVIFCGYSIADENVKEILFDIKEHNNRPQYVIVDPSLERGDVNYWKANRFDCFSLQFTDFMNQLDSTIPSSVITLGKAIQKVSSISKIIPSHSEPSTTLNRYLIDECIHIHNAYTTPLVSPKDFYRGLSNGFEWIKEEYDVRRRVTDTLLCDLIIDTGKSTASKPLFYILHGYAGSGKSVTLKRFAWEAATEFGVPLFYLDSNSVLRIDEICELSRLIESRIFLIIDDILIHKNELKQLLIECKKRNLSVTILGGARTNEWNVHADAIAAEVEAEYDLLHLMSEEVKLLIEKLEITDCLGYLKSLKKEDRVNYFRNKLQNQLLVALHEATEGRNFEEIVSDEYQKISSPDARILYLDICTLDRFDVGIRANLVSRISGITYENFSKRLLRPLEHVIKVNFDNRQRDFLYKSRHQHIAELVFEEAFNSPEDRASQIVRIVKYLNASYQSDRTALERIVKGKALAKEFSDRIFATQIFEAALASGMQKSVVDHQRVVYELYHPNGDLRSALSIIKLVELNPGFLLPRTIAHTKANILRRLALITDSNIEKERFRGDAIAILNSGIKLSSDAIPYLTKGQLVLEELQERIASDSQFGDEEADSRAIVEMTKEIEKTLRDGLFKFPGDETLLNFEAALSRFLNDTPRALRALERAYERNKQSVYTVIRLVRLYALDPSNEQKIITMLRRLVAEQPTAKEVHFELARLLININEVENCDEIAQHLKRSFVHGDTHYEARFLYARHEFLFGNSENSKREYESLRRVPLPREVIHRVKQEVRDSSGELARYDGVVKTVHESFTFIRSVSFQEDIFLHYKNMENYDEWDLLRDGCRVNFSLGFSYMGPNAIHVKRVSSSVV